MPVVTPLRVVNPRRKHKFSKRSKPAANKRTRRARRNPLAGGGELILMTNPKRRRKNRVYVMNRRKKSNPFFGKKKSSRRRRSNPFFKARSYRRHRRNPSIAGNSVSDLLKLGVSAAAGGVATRSLTQMVLNTNNTGWMGYGGNLAVAIALAWAAAKFLGEKVGTGVAAGGIAATAMRIWTEKVSQTSPNTLSGMGDLDFSADGLGEYIDSWYPVPTVSQVNSKGQYINMLPPVPAAPVVAAPAKSLKGLGAASGGRFKSRFN